MTQSWFPWLRRSSAHPQARRSGTSRNPLRRARLNLEDLEDRLAPAVFNVNSLLDVLNPGPGIVTLRSAIVAANATPGGNTINLTVPGTYSITLLSTAPLRSESIERLSLSCPAVAI